MPWPRRPWASWAIAGWPGHSSNPTPPPKPPPSPTPPACTKPNWISAPEADVTARGEAECGLGLVAKWLDKPDEELSHYLNVLEAGDSENPDPYWVKQAGVAAAHWCIDRGQWTNAITIYTRVEEVVPSLRAEMEKDKDIAKAKARTKSAASGD